MTEGWPRPDAAGITAHACVHVARRPSLTDPLPPDATPGPAAPAAAVAPVEVAPVEVAPEEVLPDQVVPDETASEAASEPADAEVVAPPAPVLELEPPAPQIPPVISELPVAEPAPLAAASAPGASAGSSGASAELLGLPLKLLNELLAKIGATPLHALSDLLPALRILSLAVVAGIALKLTSATLGAIDDLPLVGGLLELVGLVSLLNFLARNAFKQQKRAELLARIQKLRTDLLG